MGRRLTLTANYICNWRILTGCHRAVITRWLPQTPSSCPAQVLPGTQIICKMVPTTMPTCISGLSLEPRWFPKLITSLCLCAVLSALTFLLGVTHRVKPSVAFRPQLGHHLSWEAFTPFPTRWVWGSSVLSPVKTLHCIFTFMILCLLQNSELSNGYARAQYVPSSHLSHG